MLLARASSQPSFLAESEATLNSHLSGCLAKCLQNTVICEKGIYKLQNTPRWSPALSCSWCCASLVLLDNAHPCHNLSASTGAACIFKGRQSVWQGAPALRVKTGSSTTSFGAAGEQNLTSNSLLLVGGPHRRMCTPQPCGRCIASSSASCSQQDNKVLASSS